MRPIAWESEENMDSTPSSWSTVSAEMVSARTRESAKATSSGMSCARWWHTMTMSSSSSTEFTVYGSVGLVDDGSTFGAPAAFMMSGACPPPAPSVWYVWIVRPSMAARVSSTNPASLRLSECRDTWMSYASATDSALRRTAGVAPQSSWTFSDDAPASICSTSAAGSEPLPLPWKPMLTGISSAAWIIRWMCQAPGVVVTPFVASVGPVPPPNSVVMPFDSAACACWGEM